MNDYVGPDWAETWDAAANMEELIEEFEAQKDDA